MMGDARVTPELLVGRGRQVKRSAEGLGMQKQCNNRVLAVGTSGSETSQAPATEINQLLTIHTAKIAG
jgi:hypothetical protein